MVGKSLFNFLMFPRNGQHVPGLFLLVVAVDPPNWAHRGFFIPPYTITAQAVGLAVWYLGAHWENLQIYSALPYD
jgi:hypothetical protein